jgi:DNA-binding LacI/PurR family transcriptional regulator
VTRLEDVARAAGVSISTVSRALTRPELVNANTLARVRRIIAESGFRPSRVARRLRAVRGPTNLVGLVIPDIQNPFFADLVRGVEDVAQTHGYVTLLANSDERAEKEAQSLDVMRAESVDGVILPPVSGGGEAVATLTEAGIPVVYVDRRPRRVTADTVVIDNERGAREATEHLLHLGHRRIGLIQGLPGLSTSRERLAGYQAALHDAQVPVDPQLIGAGDSRQAGGRRLTHQLLTGARPPTALVVSNGLMTLGALEALHRLGARVPEDVALVGFDDMPWALAVDPPLTVVRQPAEAMGRRAMELLLRRITEPAREVQVVSLQPELVVRGSCGTALAAAEG